MALSKPVVRMKGRNPTWKENQTIDKAARTDDVQLLESLIKENVNVTGIVIGFNRTALHVAAIHGSCNVMSILITNGAKVNAVDILQWTPLHDAARHGHTDSVAILVANGADVNMKTRDGNTPLQLAVNSNHSNTVSYFINKLKMDPSQYDKETQQKIKHLLKREKTSRKHTDSVDKHSKSPDPQEPYRIQQTPSFLLWTTVTRND